jgi:MFS family permease
MIPKLSLPKDRAKTWLATANVIVIANAFIWYLLAFNIIGQHVADVDKLLVYGVNIFGIIAAGLIGTLVAERVKERTKFLYLWLIAGVFVSLLPLVMGVTDLPGLTAISLVLGLYFGFGMPTTMGFHNSFIDTKERAKTGGLTFLVIGLLSAVIVIALPQDLTIACLGLAIIRIVGLLFFHYMPKKESVPSNQKPPVKYRSIITNKTFLLFIVPWLMFTLINYLAATMIYHNYQNTYESLTAYEDIPIAITAVISGFIADRWGRKRLTITGFIILGIGYAILGFSNQGGTNPLGLMTYVITDGIAWGILYVLFLFTVWGDLAHSSYSDKFFFLGALPYVSSYFLKVLFLTSLPETIPIGLVSSFATVFLFLAVLPLVYAPETLPEKLMKDRDLKSYVENAKKRAQKETEKNQEKKKTSDDVTTEEQDASLEEAKKLAEKYY